MFHAPPCFLRGVIQIELLWGDTLRVRPFAGHRWCSFFTFMSLRWGNKVPARFSGAGLGGSVPLRGKYYETLRT